MRFFVSPEGFERAKTGQKFNIIIAAKSKEINDEVTCTIVF